MRSRQNNVWETTAPDYLHYAFVFVISSSFLWHWYFFETLWILGKNILKLQ